MDSLPQRTRTTTDVRTKSGTTKYRQSLVSLTMLSWLITMMVPGRAGENNEQSRDLRQGGDARGLRQPPTSPLRQPVQTGNASAADDGQGLLNQSFNSADQQNSQYQSPPVGGVQQLRLPWFACRCRPFPPLWAGSEMPLTRTFSSRTMVGGAAEPRLQAAHRDRCTG